MLKLEARAVAWFEKHPAKEAESGLERVDELVREVFGDPGAAPPPRPARKHTLKRQVSEGSLFRKRLYNAPHAGAATGFGRPHSWHDSPGLATRAEATLEHTYRPRRSRAWLSLPAIQEPVLSPSRCADSPATYVDLSVNESPLEASETGYTQGVTGDVTGLWKGAKAENACPICFDDIEETKGQAAARRGLEYAEWAVFGCSNPACNKGE